MRYKSLAYAAAAVITLVGCVDHTETPAAVSLNDTSQETGLSDASSPDNDQGSRGASDTEPPKWPAGAILSFTPEGLQSARLAWPLADDNTAVVSYEIYRDGVQAQSVSHPTTSTVLDSIPIGTDINIEVVATDAANNRSEALQLTARLDDDEPPSWPSTATIIASQLTDTSVTLSWSPASDNVGVHTYHVQQNGAQIGTTSNTQFAVEDLLPWTTYQFSIDALDALGNTAPNSLSITVTTADNSPPIWPPGSSLTGTNITESGLTLHWTPAEDDVAVTGYRITRGTELVGEVDADITSIQVDGLNPWSINLYRVEAVDGAGNWSTGGPFYAAQQPDLGLPYWAPEDTLTVHALTPYSITVGWPQANDNVSISAYSLTLNDSLVGSFDANTYNAELTGLSPWTDYTVSIRAQDNAGNWTTLPLTQTVKTTDETSPVWPTAANLAVTELGATSANLEWSAATDDVAVTEYVVAVGGQILNTFDGSATNGTVEGLVDGTTQTIDIIARDAAGNASVPLSVTVDTPEACYDDLQQFEQEIWLPFMSTDCLGCHIQGGLAGDTQFVLQYGTTPEVVEANYAMLEGIALDQSMGASLLLLKPTGQVAHTGGQRFAEGDAIYDAFVELVARYEEPGGCEDPSLKYACANAPINPGPSPIRRLTSTQYHNTIADLFAGLLGSGSAFPETIITGGFSSYTAPNLVSAAGAQAIFDSTEYIGSQITENVTNLVDCADQAELPCVVDFIKSFGLRAYRRPVTNDELASLFNGYQQAPFEASFGDKIARLVEIMLQSPQFLYIHAADGTEVEGQPGVVALSHYGLASRLSYFLWDSMPDQVLFDRAAAGDLNNPAAISEEVDRMLDDPRAKAMVARFHDEWLHLYRLDTAEKDPTLFPGYNAALAQAMREETDRLVEHVVFDGDGLFQTLMSTTQTFVTPELAAVYGVNTSGSSPGEWTQITLPEERTGLLTRAAFAAAHAYSHGSSPIHRGHFILEGVLCQKLVIPPVDIGELPEVPQGTIKDRLAQHRTEAVCASCHDRMDPLGLGFEHFDAIGQWRDTYTNGLPVDASGTLDNPSLDFAGASDMLTQLEAVPAVQSCYAKQWFRYASGRSEKPADKCSLESITDTFQSNGGNVIDLIHAITQSDSFRYRWATEQEAENE